jgi:hypothetical protein
MRGTAGAVHHTSGSPAAHQQQLVVGLGPWRHHPAELQRWRDELDAGAALGAQVCDHRALAAHDVAHLRARARARGRVQDNDSA